MKNKKQIAENLKKINPFILVVALTLLYFIFIIIIQYVEFEGKAKDLTFVIMPGDKNKEKKVEPLIACLFSILLVFSFYFLIGLSRLVVRKLGSNTSTSTNSLL